MILNLISGPRNVSTALMYSFAQRGDTQVLDEPFYAVFLAKTGVQHPGTEAVLGALPSHEKIVRRQLTATTSKPVLFVKNMAHHMEVLEEPFVEGAKNIFLIRDPRQILASYSAVISSVAMRDIGIAFQYSLFCRLQERGLASIVIDSTFLLKNPGSILKRLCRLCGLEYEQRMEHWPQGPKSYDGVWAPYWYGNVHRTTGFEAPPATSPALPAHLHALNDEAQAIYEKLRPFSLKA